MADERSPTEIRLHQMSRVMEIVFADGRAFRLPYEFLQTGKREVQIASLEPVGSYAVQPVFSDGHLARLQAAGAKRD